MPSDLDVVLPDPDDDEDDDVPDDPGTLAEFKRLESEMPVNAMMVLFRAKQDGAAFVAWRDSWVMECAANPALAFVTLSALAASAKQFASLVEMAKQGLGKAAN